QVTAGTTYTGEFIKLDADLTFNTGNAVDWATTPAAHTVPRVGVDGKKFSGTFDGYGHTVSGVYMSGETDDGIGLFADIAGATIQNLLVRNSYIGGQDYVGTIAGEVSAETTIKNIYVHSDVTVESTQSASGKLAQTGGIVGACYGKPQFTLTLSDCVFAGTVLAAATYTGGLIGAGNSSPNKHDVVLTNCLMIGVVPNKGNCGGFFSTNNCKADTGTVNTTITGCVYAGRQFGSYPFGSGSTYGTVTVTNCYTTTLKENNMAYKSLDAESAEGVAAVTLKALMGTDASVTIPGWTKRANDIMIPSGIASFAGLPQMIVLQYTITWENDDGTVLATEVYDLGEVPEYKGEDPTKAEDENYTYKFNRWSPVIEAVIGDATYTAVFSRSGKLIPADSETDEVPVTTTEAPATTTAAPEKPAKKGCKSVIGSGIAVIMMIAGAGVVLCRKKER
ncbi:MAG: hypothetical protein II955_02610, partial [Clostridia bacterium]|nr:hypothetical protein [Clostridia bacterium]